jgi:hypothetical protein
MDTPASQERQRCARLVEDELNRETDEVVKGLLRRILNRIHAPENAGFSSEILEKKEDYDQENGKRS